MGPYEGAYIINMNNGNSVHNGGYGGLEKLSMLTMSSKLFQPRLSFLHMLIMGSRIDII